MKNPTKKVLICIFIVTVFVIVIGQVNAQEPEFDYYIYLPFIVSNPEPPKLEYNISGYGMVQLQPEIS